MSSISLNTHEIVAQTCVTDDLHIVEDVQLGGQEWRNELLLFVKPEVFMVEDASKAENALKMVFDKLSLFEVHIKGVVIVGGKALEAKEIMNHHYGFINELSRRASSLLTSEDRMHMMELLNLNPSMKYPFLGGHEFLAQHPEMKVETLDKIWATKKSIKLKSGFYFQVYNLDNQQIILVNGFHPLQLAHFTNPTHRVLLVLLASNTDWRILRQEMVGDTFPEKAHPSSIRGTFFADPQKFGFTTVSIANNGVHLSAGPFEAAFEITNFFGNLLELDMRQNRPMLISELQRRGLSYEKASLSLTNPLLTQGKPVSLFGATEDVDTEKAAELWLEAVNSTRG